MHVLCAARAPHPALACRHPLRPTGRRHLEERALCSQAARFDGPTGGGRDVPALDGPGAVQAAGGPESRLAQPARGPLLWRRHRRIQRTAAALRWQYHSEHRSPAIEPQPQQGGKRCIRRRPRRAARRVGVKPARAFQRPSRSVVRERGTEGGPRGGAGRRATERLGTAVRLGGAVRGPRDRAGRRAAERRCAAAHRLGDVQWLFI
mmetsp:Transcript_10902/g.34498  ORF Transcript_10902/g.34498 Transcript_10902/m.34498 type:complete len:206 (-) Transcript_10902:55-672(-)